MNPSMIRWLAIKELRQFPAPIITLFILALLSRSKDVGEIFQLGILCTAIWIGGQIVHGEYISRSWNYTLTKPVAREWILLIRYVTNLVWIFLTLGLAWIAKLLIHKLPLPPAWQFLDSILFPVVPASLLLTEMSRAFIACTFAITIGFWQPWMFRKTRQILCWIAVVFVCASVKELTELQLGPLHPWNVYHINRLLFGIACLAASFGFIREIQVKE